MLTQPQATGWKALVWKASRRPRAGEILLSERENAAPLRVLGDASEREILVELPGNGIEYLEQYGHLPLPPLYPPPGRRRRRAALPDRVRPHARRRGRSHGRLHFTSELLQQKLREKACASTRSPCTWASARLLPCRWRDTDDHVSTRKTSASARRCARAIESHPPDAPVVAVGNHRGARAGICGARKAPAANWLAVHAAFHSAGIFVSSGGFPHHQLSSAALHPASAGVGPAKPAKSCWMPTARPCANATVSSRTGTQCICHDETFLFHLCHRRPRARQRHSHCARRHRNAHFHAVGTYGSVKAVGPDDCTPSAPHHLGNTFHLHERPGEDLVENFGGLHEMMRWDGAISHGFRRLSGVFVGATGQNHGRGRGVPESDRRFAALFLA